MTSEIRKLNQISAKLERMSFRNWFLLLPFPVCDWLIFEAEYFPNMTRITKIALTNELWWVDSFLSGRKQCILVGDKTSDDFNLNCGVPRGSCMGPILFTLYVSRLFNIISQHLPSVHGYADDTVIFLGRKERYVWETQTYLSFRPYSIHSEVNTLSVMEKCIADVRS